MIILAWINLITSALLLLRSLEKSPRHELATVIVVRLLFLLYFMQSLSIIVN